MKRYRIGSPFFIGIAATLLVATTGFAAGTTLEGKIQGANCVIHKTVCPINAQDPHVALENEFVLVTDSGNYYFLPNLSRSLKTKYLNQEVRVTGDKSAHAIIASNVDVKANGAYTTVWNWDSIVERINTGN